MDKKRDRAGILWIRDDFHSRKLGWGLGGIQRRTEYPENRISKWERSRRARISWIKKKSISFSLQGGQLCGKISPRTTILYFSDSSTSSFLTTYYFPSYKIPNPLIQIWTSLLQDVVAVSTVSSFFPSTATWTGRNKHRLGQILWIRHIHSESLWYSNWIRGSIATSIAQADIY